MSRKKIARILLVLAVFASLTLTELTPLSLVQDASAVTQADIDKLKDELSGMNSEKSQLEKELKSIQNDKSAALAQKENIDKQINLLQSEIKGVESLISEYETLITQTEQEIRENEEEEARQYEKFCERVRSMEERGTVSYWSVLFDSASFSDLLSAMDFISEIMDSDQKVIDDLRALREQIEQTNAAIEKAQREYDLNKAAELKYGKLPPLRRHRCGRLPAHHPDRRAGCAGRAGPPAGDLPQPDAAGLRQPPHPGRSGDHRTGARREHHPAGALLGVLSAAEQSAADGGAGGILPAAH